MNCYEILTCFIFCNRGDVVDSGWGMPNPNAMILHERNHIILFHHSLQMFFNITAAILSDGKDNYNFLSCRQVGKRSVLRPMDDFRGGRIALKDVVSLLPNFLKLVIIISH